MGFSPSLKKMLLVGTVILFSCDVSMLFAAPSNTASTVAAAQQQPSPQLQQLQAQVQAQIQALQKQNPAASSTQIAQSVAQQNGQPARNDLLPPSPFNPPQGAQNLGGQGNFVPPPSALPQATSDLPAPQSSDAAAPQPDAGTAVTESDLNTAAFNSMVQSSLPMSPTQIQKLRSMYMASQFAASNVPGTPPRPTATSTFVDLSPGATPPVIRLSQGFVTSLVFVDSTGAPWPIESYDVGNPSAFNIQWDKTGNTLMVQSTVLYTYGNLAVKLRGLDTPVMITLIPGQKAVDYRVDLRIQGFGPHAKPFSGDTLPDSTSSDLLNVLDGVPPAGSHSLDVEGGDCQAWVSGGKMYVRTRLNVLSPGWIATLSSADGMHAYEMQPAPMLLVSQNGQVSQLRVKGF